LRFVLGNVAGRKALYDVRAENAGKLGSHQQRDEIST
jgi:hypothetical protein